MNKKHYDAVILLGGSVNQDGSLRDTAKVRLDRAALLYRQNQVDAIVVCGSHGYKSIEKPVTTEAKAYATYLLAIGIPEDKIFLEEESRDTMGNLLFAKMHIIMKQEWRSLLVIPTYSQSTERINYLLRKIFGTEYSSDILRVNENTEQANLAREARSLQLTKEINDKYDDGDHEAIYRGLIETHPAYGGTKWTVDELRKKLGS